MERFISSETSHLWRQTADTCHLYELVRIAQVILKSNLWHMDKPLQEE